jgi:hypothetical protein
MGGYKIRSRKNLHVIKSNGLFKLIVMKSSLYVKSIWQGTFIFLKIQKKKKIVQNVEVGNFSCPKMIKTLNPLKSFLH